jgi:hypothetical protein
MKGGRKAAFFFFCGSCPPKLKVKQTFLAPCKPSAQRLSINNLAQTCVMVRREAASRVLRGSAIAERPSMTNLQTSVMVRCEARSGEPRTMQPPVTASFILV